MECLGQSFITTSFFETTRLLVKTNVAIYMPALSWPILMISSDRVIVWFTSILPLRSESVRVLAEDGVLILKKSLAGLG